jgi:signal transduction histidine kinase
MRRQVEVHLARARATSAGTPYGARVNVRGVTEGLVRTLNRLYAEKEGRFTIDVPESCSVRCEAEDLEEMLGNILENACKWARSGVTISAVRQPEGVVIVVDDDGPGIVPELRERVLKRGVRADETAPGSGLGLAIVRDLADLYGGRLVLGSAPGGGLRVELILP